MNGIVYRVGNVKTVTRSVFGPGGHRERYIDIASILRRSDRVLTITHLGWYHEVLRHPPDRQTGIVYRVGNVKPLLGAPSRGVQTVRSEHGSELLRAFGRAVRETLTIKKLTRYHPVVGQPSIC